MHVVDQVELITRLFIFLLFRKVTTRTVDRREQGGLLWLKEEERTLSKSMMEKDTKNKLQSSSFSHDDLIPALLQGQGTIKKKNKKSKPSQLLIRLLLQPLIQFKSQCLTRSKLSGCKKNTAFKHLDICGLHTCALCVCHWFQGTPVSWQLYCKL